MSGIDEEVYDDESKQENTQDHYSINDVNKIIDKSKDIAQKQAEEQGAKAAEETTKAVAQNARTNSG